MPDIPEPRQPHGTYATAMWHSKYGVPACASCRKAQADYMKARRQSNPAKYRAELDRDHARLAALWRLSALYPRQFQALVADEKRARGVS